MTSHLKPDATMSSKIIHRLAQMTSANKLTSRFEEMNHHHLLGPDAPLTCARMCSWSMAQMQSNSNFML